MMPSATHQASARTGELFGFQAAGAAGAGPWLSLEVSGEDAEAAAAWAGELGLAWAPAAAGLPGLDGDAPVVFLDWPACHVLNRDMILDKVRGHAASGADLTLPAPGWFGDLRFTVARAGVVRDMGGHPAPGRGERVVVNRHVPSLEVLRRTPWLEQRYLAAISPGLVVSFSETCSMGCGMCPIFGREMPAEHRDYYTAYRLRRQGRDFASPELVAASLDAFAACLPLRAVSVFGPGEPFQNPRAVELMGLCAERGIAMTFATNAHHLDEAAFRALEEMPVDTVIVSLDAATAETYRRVKANGDYARAMRTVERLSAGRTRGSGYRLCLSFIRQDHNRCEEEFFLRRFAGAADELAVTSKYHRGIPEDAPLWEAPDLLPCSSLDHSVHVLTDGACWACSAGVPDELGLGDVLADGAPAVLRSHGQSVRRRLRSGQAMDACAACQWWRQAQRREVFANGRLVRVERPYSYKVLG